MFIIMYTDKSVRNDFFITQLAVMKLMVTEYSSSEPVLTTDVPHLTVTGM